MWTLISIFACMIFIHVRGEVGRNCSVNADCELDGDEWCKPMAYGPSECAPKHADGMFCRSHLSCSSGQCAAMAMKIGVCVECQLDEDCGEGKFCNMPVINSNCKKSMEFVTMMKARHGSSSSGNSRYYAGGWDRFRKGWGSHGDSHGGHAMGSHGTSQRTGSRFWSLLADAVQQKRQSIMSDSAFGSHGPFAGMIGQQGTEMSSEDGSDPRPASDDEEVEMSAGALQSLMKTASEFCQIRKTGRTASMPVSVDLMELMKFVRNQVAWSGRAKRNLSHIKIGNGPRMTCEPLLAEGAACQRSAECSSGKCSIEGLCLA